MSGWRRIWAEFYEPGQTQDSVPTTPAMIDWITRYKEDADFSFMLSFFLGLCLQKACPTGADLPPRVKDRLASCQNYLPIEIQPSWHFAVTSLKRPTSNRAGELEATYSGSRSLQSHLLPSLNGGKVPVCVTLLFRDDVSNALQPVLQRWHRRTA